MGRKKQIALEPGDKVGVANPVNRSEVLHGRLVGFRDGGRTAKMQHPYEFRARAVPTEYVYREH